MIRPLAFAAVALAAVGAAATVTTATTAPQPERARVARVQVHCPQGNREAFVTPARLRIGVGDTVEWNMAGPTPSDSIIITPKSDDQVWPFDGEPARGGARARGNRAQRRGTYSYNVDMLCRVRGGEPQRVVIDPDIIID